MNAWDDAFAFTVGEEGGYSTDPHDSGNWTGGAQGQGELRGTKYGISAAAFPAEDIEHLILERAKILAKQRYWTPLGGDLLPPAIAVALFDCAFNQGLGRAVMFLQRTLHVTVDDRLGPGTLAALQSADVKVVLAELTVQRIMGYTRDRTWADDGEGWTRRAIATMGKAELYL